MLCWVFFYMYNFLMQFEWPEPDKKNGITETKMVYVFDYLPSGLFNRGQVKHYRQVFWLSFHNWLVFIKSSSPLPASVQYILSSAVFANSYFRWHNIAKA